MYGVIWGETGGCLERANLYKAYTHGVLWLSFPCFPLRRYGAVSSGYLPLSFQTKFNHRCLNSGSIFRLPHTYSKRLILQ